MIFYFKYKASLARTSLSLWLGARINGHPDYMAHTIGRKDAHTIIVAPK